MAYIILDRVISEEKRCVSWLKFAEDPVSEGQQEISQLDQDNSVATRHFVSYDFFKILFLMSLDSMWVMVILT